LRHPNVVAYHDSFFDEHEERLFIVQASFAYRRLHAKLGQSSVCVVKVFLLIGYFSRTYLTVALAPDLRVLPPITSTFNHFFSSIQHLGGSGCLDNKREDYQNCSVLYCVPQLYRGNYNPINVC